MRRNFNRKRLKPHCASADFLHIPVQGIVIGTEPVSIAVDVHVRHEDAFFQVDVDPVQSGQQRADPVGHRQRILLDGDIQVIQQIS